MNSKFKKIIATVLVLVMVAGIAPLNGLAVDNGGATESVSVQETESTNFLGTISKFIKSIFYSRITFDTNGGSEIEDIYALKLLVKVKEPDAPTKEGYTFAGWDPQLPSRMPLRNMTVRALWEEKTYTVNWFVDGAKVKETTCKFNHPIEYYTPEKEGYTFLGWKDFPNLMPAEDINLYAEFSINTYTVTWVADNNREVVSYDYGETIETAADPVKEGYTFIGWSGEKFDIMPAHDVEYVAQFSVNSYTATFLTERGSFPTGDKSVAVTTNYGENIKVPDLPSREGYTFAGWDVLVPETMPAEDITLNATWISRDDTPYTVETYVMDINGEYPGPQINQYAGTSDTLVTYTPNEIEGFHIDDKSILTINVEPNGSGVIKVYYARNEYTVTFVIDNSIDEDVVETYLYGQAVVPPEELERGGHAFAGWRPEIAEMVTADATYTAKWESTVRIIETVDNRTYDNAVLSLPNQITDSDFDVEAALNDKYYLERALASVKDYSRINLESLNAETIVISNDNHLALQFANKEYTAQCVNNMPKMEGVKYAEPDKIQQLEDPVIYNDIPYTEGASWGKQYIKADQYSYYLERTEQNTKNINVAVIDSGLDVEHPYFEGRLSPVSASYLGEDGRVLSGLANVQDSNFHGTHVTGIIIDCTENLTNISIIPIKVINSQSICSDEAVARAIQFAIDSDANVINLSLCGKHSQSVDEEIQAAIDEGIVVVVAAGNSGANISDNNLGEDGENVLLCPAHIEGAIVVGAIDESGTRADFSDYGEELDLVAPGVGIKSRAPLTFKKMFAPEYDDIPDIKFGMTLPGTSQAAPHIAAAAAMYILAYPEYSPAEIEKLIKQYCVDLGETGKDDYYGYGTLNMYNSIPDCKVSFNANGGSTPQTVTVKSTGTVTMPSSTKSYKITYNANGGTVSKSFDTKYCTLEGWYNSPDLVGTKYIVGENNQVIRDSIYYAKWTDPIAGDYPTASRSNFKFDGWWTAANGGTQFSSSTVMTGNMTIYAHWSQCTITYHANGGSGGPSTQNGYNNVTISTSKPSRNDYMFLGWSTSSSATSPSYFAGGSINLTSNVDLYAVWGRRSVTLSKSSDTINQNLYSNDGSTGADNVVRFVGEETMYIKFTLPTPSYQNVSDLSGYTGWKAESYPNNALEPYFSGNEVYVTQPGTYNFKYYVNGYASDAYQLNLSLYFVPWANNWSYFKEPDDRNGSYPDIQKNGQRINIISLHHNCYTQRYGGYGECYGYVHCEDKNGVERYGYVYLFKPSGQ